MLNGFFRGLRRALAVAGLAASAALPAMAQQQGGERPPQAVTVVTLESSDVTLTATLPGRVAASGVAEVRPQVNGIITERLFEEGSEVAMGDALYQIDAATYEAAKAAAEASLAQAQAQLASARREATRQQELRDRNVTSQQNLDDALAARDVAEASVKVAEANLMSAEIDLERTVVRAPISGAAGLSDATQGALVTAGQTTPLTVIRQLDPVYVDVTQSASELLQWRRSGQDAAEEEGQIVSLKLADGSTYNHTGRLAAAEPHVNEQTGVVVLRLEFPNPDDFLLPGMYVQVEMPQGKVEGAVLVPQEGVTRDRRGRPMAMVVNAENVVEPRQLTIQRDRGSDWVVTDGLSAGDRVIVAGLQKVSADMTVTPQERQAEGGEASAPPAEGAGAEAPAAEGDATGDTEGAEPAADAETAAD
ncbi:MAG: efflux RND transporter periplasmic adaptor subunit [Rhodobacteraceae bacterium]|jgi:membrane fusion protein (multidrug efflux system)|uniref:Membrane fusion protein, multidrug efflux system n=1 Tax=Salipiger profundus TaxID=1229727 RepID=A0A1U7D1R1_9RHOB|nr:MULTISPECIES: efflux RND transporter periplasmic adaptor subunit [Salipiger]APX22010.1 membrane fusion protein, multidrug efflux system [Salipiger profundus]MAB08181.1 efflux RND transporter periplasmic adaptor subunit [Paracoccaceae bacterium]GGA06860.1 hemolysin D [Salipiger profundus]SFC41055.1 membrane fusion protein, multidrug efflux system [Salipiger profundus]